MIRVSTVVVVRCACAPFESLAAFAAPEAIAAERRFARAGDAWREASAALEAGLFDAAGPPGPAETGERFAQGRTRFALLALRRALHRGVVPSMDSLQAHPDLEPRRARAAALHAALEQARAALERALSEADLASAAALGARIRDPAFAEGLFLAGEELLASARRLAARPFPLWRARERQVAATTLRYAARAATKTSPQGVFCTTALGSFQEVPRRRGSPAPARVLARIDVAQARRLALAPTGALKPLPGTPLALNPTLCESDEHLEFWRAASPGDPAALERHLRVRDSPALRALLGWMDGDSRERARVLAWMEDHAGGKAPEWLDRLLASGLLVAGGIPHDETRPLRWMARARVGSRDAQRAAFEEAEAKLDCAGSEPAPGERVALYRAATSLLVAIAGGEPLERDALLRVDAAADVEVALPHAIAAEIARALPAYARFFAALYPRALLLEPYVRRFLARHPADRAVPVVALYHGVFESPGSGPRTAFPEATRVAPGAPESLVAGPRAAHARWRAFLEERVRDADARGAHELVLAEADWEALAGDTPPPRFACGLLFQAAAAPGASLLTWNALYGAGLAAARLAWLHAGEEGPAAGPLAREIREGWAWLAEGDALVAEIPFHHEGRTANAGLKPRVFEHELLFPGTTPSPGASTIPLSDLDVRYDSRSGRFHLRSRRLGRAVVPVLTNGLGPEGFVAFLVAIGQQDAQPLAFFPEADPARPGHAPRITTGRTVLFRRRWRMTQGHAPELFEGAEGRAARFARVQRWRESADVPRHVFASTDAVPKPLYLDLDAPWSIEELARLAHANAVVTLREMEPVPEGSGLAGHALEFLAHARSEGGSGLTFAGPVTTMRA